jgi:hypothetical protein
MISLTGKVTNATSGGPVTTSPTAHLYLFDSTTSTIDQSLTSPVGATGEYRFDQVPADSNVTYFVMVDFAGVTYASDPVSYDGSFTSKDVPLTVYDATNDLTQLSISQVHLQFDIPAGTQVQARSLYILSNLGNKAVVVESDGRHVPFIGTPAGAADVQYELAQGGTALARATNGFALLPGADKQYGIIATYSMPYTNSLAISQPFTLPVSSETVLVPAGVRVKSDQLVDTGIQNFNGTDYHLYQGGSLATGSSLALTISGKPGASSPISSNQQMVLLIVLLVGGLLLIGLGIFLLRRSRGREVAAESGTPAASAESLQANRESIMDAIIALDDQYKGACISREVYLKRREELKRHLKELL